VTGIITEESIDTAAEAAAETARKNVATGEAAVEKGKGVIAVVVESAATVTTGDTGVAAGVPVQGPSNLVRRQ